MFNSPIAAAIAFLGLFACGLAFLKGGPAERIGAAVVLANFLVLRAAESVSPNASSGVFGLSVDGATACGFLVLALRYASPWLGGAMLLYAVQFSLHAFYFVTERPRDYLHALVNNADWVGVSLCLILGTVTVWRRRAVAGRDAAA